MLRTAIDWRAALVALVACGLLGATEVAEARGLWSKFRGGARQQAPAQPIKRRVVLTAATVSPPPSTANGALPLPPADAARLASDWAAAHGFDLGRSPLEDALLADMSDGRLDRMPVWDAALVASQVRDETRLARYRAALDLWVDQCRPAVEAAADPQAKAQVLFEFMHREILRGGYQVDCTDLTRLIDSGEFNCVSSALVFGGLTSRFDLDVSAVELTGHAYCVLDAGRRRIDIETTCPRWFAVLDDPQLRKQLVERTLGVEVDRGPASSKREVPLAALVGTIYYNRGVECLQQRQFAEALAANVKALWIDGASDATWGNLLASVNNWALAQAEAGQHAAAVRLLEQGAQLAPRHELFTTNLLAIYQRWFDELAALGRSEEAVQLVAAQPRADAAWNELAASVYRRHALELAAHDRRREALATLAEARQRYGARPELAAAEAEIRSGAGD